MYRHKKLAEDLASHALSCREALTQGNQRPVWSGGLKIEDLTCIDLDLSYANFPAGMQFFDSSLWKCDLSHAKFPSACFERVRLDGCSLRGTSLTHSSFQNSLLNRIDFTGAYVKGSRLQKCYLQELVWAPRGLIDFHILDCEAL